MLGHKTILNKFKNIESISSIYSDHKPMLLQINQEKKTKKHKKIWKLNNMFINNDWVKMRSRKKSNDTWKQVKMRKQQPQICGTQGKQSQN